MGFFSDFFKKSTPFNMNITQGYSKDSAHPEKKRRSYTETNKEANILRLTNDLVSSYNKVVVAGVVGTGLSQQFKSKDEELNIQVEEWLEFCSEKGNADITKEFYREALERLATSELAVKGGFIIRHHWDDTLETLYAPELLSMDTVDRTKNNFDTGLFSGVQINKLGQITGIWIYTTPSRNESIFVEKSHFDFCILKLDPHQYGNISPLSAIMSRLDGFDDYNSSEIDGAKERSQKSIIMASPAADRILDVMKEWIEKKNISETDRERYVQEYKKALQSYTTPGIHNSAVTALADTKVFDLQKSGSSVFPSISENSKQTIAKGLGYSAGSVAGIPEHSYNSALKSAQDEESQNAIFGQDIISIFKIVYRKYIEAGVILGELDIPDYFQNKRKYNRYLKLTRKIRGHIDPLKQVNADGAEIEYGLESTIQKLANKNRDYLDVIQDEVQYELARKQAYEQAGLSYIQKGTEKIAIEQAKKALQEQEAESQLEKENANLNQKIQGKTAQLEREAKLLAELDESLRL